ncbi:hypothetical protein H8B15_07065 [Hymenobacter sp. BT507]|uniref:YCII-related domain-containing protein n=1 Tax=Hymenobacter citatus TaxID=2763506 RepID=A0ABR7MHZ1_9BACT|nr:YciI family protein [Hymenobacter citatus]MBC6610676.1 hypothetical protein [Hymenobacter citatus]
MQQYLITAYDYTDPEALQRRLAVRENHLAGARRLKATGNFLTGGAILDAEGKMIGSMMVAQFATPEDLAAWQRDEPYLTGRVWEKVEIQPFRMADV